MRRFLDETHIHEGVPIEFFRRKLYLEFERARLLRVIRILRGKLSKRPKRTTRPKTRR
jgi:hypothetical protein